MAQAPATPKWKRAALLAAPPALATRWADTESAQAALAARAARRSSVPAETVTFLIPLVGPDHVSDWDAVSARLTTTLLSFQRQNNPNWQAVVCCQRQPPLPDDRRVHFLPFDDPAPGNDKWCKLAALCAALPRFMPRSGYAMSFDADDLLRQGAVGEMLDRQAPGGYLVQSGYVLDHATRRVALADRRSLSAPMRKPFWKLCGSCAALRVAPENRESVAFLGQMTAHEHRMFPYLAALAGQRLTPLARPSVLYVLNHGENFGARRGRVSFKRRFVERYALPQAEADRLFEADFPPP